MKKLSILYLILIGLTISPFVKAQTTDIPTDIFVALRTENSSKLASFFDTNVELAIENQTDVYSKEQAKSIIANFFRKNTVVNFQLLHKGSKESANFAIGTLKTSNGTFRVYLFTKKNEIQQLRIELSNE